MKNRSFCLFFALLISSSLGHFFPFWQTSHFHPPSQSNISLSFSFPGTMSLFSASTRSLPLSLPFPPLSSFLFFFLHPTVRTQEEVAHSWIPYSLAWMTRRRRRTLALASSLGLSRWRTQPFNWHAANRGGGTKGTQELLNRGPADRELD